MFRKTRFVCISDTHNASPADGAFRLPKGDVLIHAGDLTNQGTYAEIHKTLDWIGAADFEAKIVVAGNHDITLDDQFYAEHSSQFHNQYPQNSQRCIDLCKNHPSINYLNHEAIDIQLTKDDGPRTKFKVFGSPYSPADGLWAFGYRPEEASRLWKQIPLDTDIIVTHTPPKHHCDKSNTRGIAGCETLRQMLWWVRPHLVVCGHIHDGRGAERVMWNLTSPDWICEESGVRYWEDPGHNNKKQSLLNLSANGDFPLANTMYNESTSSRDAVDSQRIVQKSMSMVPWINKSEATS